MKNLAVFVCVMLFSLCGHAQAFSVSQSYVTFAGPANQTEIPSPYWTPTVYNTSGDTLTLRWVRAEENIPPWWRSSICTEYYCFAIPDDSATWTLLPGDSDMIYVHMYPYGYSDTGNVVVKLFDVNNPADSARIMFHADIGVGVEEYYLDISFHADILLHTVTFSDNDGGNYTLLDLTGREIETAAVLPFATQTLNAGKSGLYFLRKENPDGSYQVIKLML